MTSNAQMQVRHPLDAMQIGAQAYGFTGKPLIKIGLNKTRGEKIFKQLKLALTRFDLTVKNSITKFQMESDNDISELFTESRLDLVKSAIALEFLNKYDDEISVIDTAEELVDFLKEIIGTTSPAEKAKQAKKQLDEATRHSDEEETFTRFFTRLSTLAKQCDSNATIQSFLIKNAFEKSINANLKQYLCDHDELDSEPIEIAKFLDKKRKYKKIARINEIDAVQNSAFQKEFMSQMAAQNQVLSALADKITQLTTQNSQLTTQNSKFEAEINKLKAAPKHEKSNNATATKVFTPKPEWELNKYGKPYRCRKCGLLGHKDENCKGTHLTCNNCKQVGHIAPACKQSKN